MKLCAFIITELKNLSAASRASSSAAAAAASASHSSSTHQQQQAPVLTQPSGVGHANLPPSGR